jgi:hypothetical protein
MVSAPPQYALSILRLKSEPTGSGDLIYLNLAGHKMVILNSQKVAADLLDRRAAIYSDRPALIVGSEMCGGFFIPFARYGDV